ncbi:hypothetical protein CITRIK5_70066 [Citricoccus sp. K5]|nr:hypothetical protein CITRIK5_70066 [Citricoccus sp. K5]
MDRTTSADRSPRTAPPRCVARPDPAAWGCRGRPRWPHRCAAGYLRGGGRNHWRPRDGATARSPIHGGCLRTRPGHDGPARRWTGLVQSSIEVLRSRQGVVVGDGYADIFVNNIVTRPTGCDQTRHECDLVQHFNNIDFQVNFRPREADSPGGPLEPRRRTCSI